MNKTLILKTSLVAAALLALPAAYAATMSKADYKAGKSQISATYKADKAACATSAGNARDVCIEESKAREKVALAEHEYAYTAKADDQNKVWVTKARTGYAVAKEKCDDLAGNGKDVCVKEAKAVEVKLLADAKMGKQIDDVKDNAADAKRDANLKVAAEKCDSLAGDAKAACMANARAMFGKP